jgi:predicted RNase H-like HicB family nuclease
MSTSCMILTFEDISSETYYVVCFPDLNMSLVESLARKLFTLTIQLLQLFQLLQLINCIIINTLVQKYYGHLYKSKKVCTPGKTINENFMQRFKGLCLLRWA